MKWISAALAAVVVASALAACGGQGSKPQVVGSSQPTQTHSSHLEHHGSHAKAALGSPDRPATIGQTLKLSDDVGDTADVTLVGVQGDNYTLRVKNVGSNSYMDDIPTDVSVIDADGQAHQGSPSIYGPCANSPLNMDPTIQPGQYMQGCVTISDRSTPVKLTVGLFENQGSPGAWTLPGRAQTDAAQPPTPTTSAPATQTPSTTAPASPVTQSTSPNAAQQAETTVYDALSRNGDTGHVSYCSPDGTTCDVHVTTAKPGQQDQVWTLTATPEWHVTNVSVN